MTRTTLVLAALIAITTSARGEDSPRIHVDACKAYTEPARKTATDCTAVAAKICDGQAFCEVPIGHNLDARASESAKIDILYSCGKAHGEAGPNDLDDHAAVTLACALTN